MQNVSTFGLSASIIGSNTFPNGFIVTEWADDADPLDSPDLEIAQSGMGTNGDMVVWSRPEGIEIALAVIPWSLADQNLDALFNSNRVSKGKTSAQDVITIALAYPNGVKVNMSPGIALVGSVVPQAQSSGRVKTRNYKFRFENVSKSGMTQTA